MVVLVRRADHKVLAINHRCNASRKIKIMQRPGMQLVFCYNELMINDGPWFEPLTWLTIFYVLLL